MPMLFAPIAASAQKFTREELKKDHETREKFGTCAVGKRALYLGIYPFDRFFYIPIKSVERVYKRLGVSKGFYQQNKTFITLSYIVVVYDGGKEKVSRFTHEEDVDAMLGYIKAHTEIPVGKK